VKYKLLLPLSLLLLFIYTLIANISTYSITNATNQNQQIITESLTTHLPKINNNSTTITTSNNIPTAQSIYTSQSMTLPTLVGTFVWYIVDEAHENTYTSSHKKISDHNPDYLPTNLIISQGVNLSFLDADAPWDTPHPHTINILDNSSGNIVYSTGKLDYTNTSKPTILPTGKYDIIDTKYPWIRGTVTVTDNKINRSGSNLIIGGFYTPSNQVANKLDNDGGSHPGWLGYYTNEFPKNGFSILSKYSFHYATCKYCPGGFWPDQKTADHTLIIYSTSQPLSEALSKLSKMVWNNVYI
jgi:hypothetical protein